MIKGNRYILPVTFFFLINFSVSSLNFYNFKILIYAVILYSLFSVLRQYDISRILKPIIIGISVIVFVYGIVQKYYIFPKIISGFIKQDNNFSKLVFERVSSGRVFSIFTLPTLYGIIASVLVLLLFNYIKDDYTSVKSIYIIFMAFILFIGIYNIVLTQSFGAILYLSVGILIFLILDKTVDIKYVSLILMIMALVVFIVVGMRYKEAKNLEPVKLRLTNWNQAVRMIKSSPLFGVGLGNYGANVSYYTEEREARSIYAHNFILQLVAEIGLPLFIFILLFILYNRKKIIPENIKSKAIYLSVLGMLLLYNLIDIGMYFFSAAVIFVVALSQIYPKRLKGNTISIVLLIISSLLYGAIYLSDSYLSEANLLVGLRKESKAYFMYEKSLKINPYNFTAILGKSGFKELNINEKNYLIDSALKIFPNYAVGLYKKSIIEYKRGHLLNALYYSGVAYKKSKINKVYRKWYEFIKRNLPSRNIK